MYLAMTAEMRRATWAGLDGRWVRRPQRPQPPTGPSPAAASASEGATQLAAPAAEPDESERRR
jgi:hypothetical protein